MKKVFTILILFLSSISFAQEEVAYKKGDTIYYNYLFRMTKKEDAFRFAIVKDMQMKEEKPLYQMEFYKLNDVSQTFLKKELMYTKSVKYIFRTGENTVFWDNGIKKSFGLRKNDDRIGIWTNYYENGMKMSEYEYFDQEKIPSPRESRLLNFWNRKGELIVKQGTGSYFLKDENGDEYMGEMLNYDKEGIWRGNRKDGSKIYKELYRGGKLKQGESWDEEGNRYTYDSIYLAGNYAGGKRELARMIRDNFKVPEYALGNNIEGLVKVYFEISEKGKLENIIVFQSLCEPCDQEAVRVVKLLTDWEISKRRGQNTKTKYILPFRINIEAK